MFVQLSTSQKLFKSQRQHHWQRYTCTRNLTYWPQIINPPQNFSNKADKGPIRIVSPFFRNRLRLPSVHDIPVMLNKASEKPMDPEALALIMHSKKRSPHLIPYERILQISGLPSLIRLQFKTSTLCYISYHLNKFWKEIITIYSINLSTTKIPFTNLEPINCALVLVWKCYPTKQCGCHFCLQQIFSWNVPEKQKVT